MQLYTKEIFLYISTISTSLCWFDMVVIIIFAFRIQYFVYGEVGIHCHCGSATNLWDP